jgi:CHAT domain-containing protein
VISRRFGSRRPGFLSLPRKPSAQVGTKGNTEREKLSTEIERLEGALARQVAGLGKARRALSVTLEQVQSALPHKTTLIELLRYSHYLGRDKFEPRYGAVIIGAKGMPAWVPLGSADDIERNVSVYQKSVQGNTDEGTLSSVLKALGDQLWGPIEKALPAGTTTVIVSPDAELSFVSFATLLTPDDHFVGEKYSIRYVASGRDLLREFKTAKNSEASVYANPDFGSKSGSLDSKRGAAVALRSIEMLDLQSIALRPLPGTALEAAALQKKFGTSAKVFLGANATKAQLSQVDSPHILHLATHGFFLPEIDLGQSIDPLQPDREIPKGKLLNPMHRSGLALAGAQTTLAAWSRGKVPPVENNGILTAEEVGGLKLNGTWLVVLSACDTGLGEARASEGVMGLRRGFIQAGAQNLLMTLWPISDQTTVKIMLDFYDAALKSSNAPQALADTQRDWLVKLRKERGLLEAVRLAGPFIMSSQGKQ